MIDKQEIAAFRRLLRLSYTVLLIFAMLLPKLRYATLAEKLTLAYLEESISVKELPRISGHHLRLTRSSIIPERLNVSLCRQTSSYSHEKEAY